MRHRLVPRRSAGGYVESGALQDRSDERAQALPELDDADVGFHAPLGVQGAGVDDPVGNAIHVGREQPVRRFLRVRTGQVHLGEVGEVEGGHVVSGCQSFFADLRRFGFEVGRRGFGCLPVGGVWRSRRCDRLRAVFRNVCRCSSRGRSGRTSRSL